MSSKAKGRPKAEGAQGAAVSRRRGGFTLGLIVGLLLGLALALGVAVYITKAPVPFIDKVPQRTAEQDSAEAARNKDWDPNRPLAPRQPARAVSGAVAPEAASAPARDPAAILAGRDPAAAAAAPAATTALPLPPPAMPPPPGAAVTQPVKPGADAFVYLVQTGAYTRSDEAEQQRARLAMLGMESRVTEREQSGRIVYRVRVGPFEGRSEAEAAQQKLQGAGVTGQLVRVERP